MFRFAILFVLVLPAVCASDERDPDFFVDVSPANENIFTATPVDPPPIDTRDRIGNLGTALRYLKAAGMDAEAQRVREEIERVKEKDDHVSSSASTMVTSNAKLTKLIRELPKTQRREEVIRQIGTRALEIAREAERLLVRLNGPSKTVAVLRRTAERNDKIRSLTK